jgi:zinc finger HIT domain-containing protein 1
MATGPLRFRTPHIEELPTTQTRQAPGFAWVAVSGPSEDPSKNWGTNNRKRARISAAGPTESQKEALSARQQREIERKIRELNSDNSKDVQIPVPSKSAGGGGGQRLGKTTNTKKILASGKTFTHYLDDEEAEIARTGRRDGDLEVLPPANVQQRASKTPIARRGLGNESSMENSPAPGQTSSRTAVGRQATEAMEVDGTQDEAEPSLPSEAEIHALLNAPPLTYNQARSAPPPADAPPPRRFCEVCGYFGRARCMKCGIMTCSVMCKDTHDEQRCLKFYA